MLLGSGSIDPDELRTVLKSCLRESAISLPEEKLDDLTLALFESADKDRSGAITFEELKAELENFPEVMENLTIRSAVSLIPHHFFFFFLNVNPSDFSVSSHKCRQLAEAP